MKIQDTEIASIVAAVLNSDKDAIGGRTNYLRTLLIAAQEELGKKGQEPKAQMAALATVHERFYAIVLEAAQPFVPKTQKDRAIALHAKVNFARTALSALRGHVRAEGDLAALSPTKTTKGSLLKPKTSVAKPPSLKQFKARVHKQSDMLYQTLMIGLAGVDKAAAIDEMQLIMGQLNKQLLDVGMVITKDATISIGQHRPLKIGKTLFMPMKAHDSGTHATM